MIWDHSTYRSYLVEKLGGDRSRTGLRKKLAAAIPVHTTFVSQVLKGRAEFSLEQAEATNEFFAHTRDEGEYFLLLVMHGRAGSSKLRRRFEEKIRGIQEERQKVKNRVKNDDEISIKDRERFYSSHLYAAIHVLTSIPEFSTVDRIAESLRLPRERIQEMIEFLLKLGVLVSRAGEFHPGPRHVHLGGDTPLIIKHHTNWRLHTTANLQFAERNDVHYSACVSLSKADVLKIRESILKNLEGNLSVISKSNEEDAYVYSLDFYRLLS